MVIQLSWKMDTSGGFFNEFICDTITNGLTAAAVAVAPELAPAETYADQEFQALCAGADKNGGTSDGNP